MLLTMISEEEYLIKVHLEAYYQTFFMAGFDLMKDPKKSLLNIYSLLLFELLEVQDDYK